ncbi:MAG: hypothetical protein EA387_12865 [Nitriliruptor sp.]|nr:MAG: hypothetical protein EA387_12865 [Nitriliruptor sp.]
MPPAASSPERGHTPDGLDDRDTLRSVSPDGFRIGTAVAGGGDHEDQPVSEPSNTDEEDRELIGRECNSGTP